MNYILKKINLTQKATNYILKGKLSPIEKELTKFIVYKFSSEIDKKITTHIIIETMYMNALKILFTKEEQREIEILINLEGLLDSHSLHLKLTKIDI